MSKQQLSSAKCNVCGAIHQELGEIVNGEFIVTEASMEWEFNDFPKTVFKAVLKRDKATGGIYAKNTTTAAKTRKSTEKWLRRRS